MRATQGMGRRQAIRYSGLAALLGLAGVTIGGQLPQAEAVTLGGNPDYVMLRSASSMPTVPSDSRGFYNKSGIITLKDSSANELPVDTLLRSTLVKQTLVADAASITLSGLSLQKSVLYGLFVALKSTTTDFVAYFLSINEDVTEANYRWVAQIASTAPFNIATDGINNFLEDNGERVAWLLMNGSLWVSPDGEVFLSKIDSCYNATKLETAHSTHYYVGPVTSITRLDFLTGSTEDGPDDVRGNCIAAGSYAKVWQMEPP